jgi:Sec-independent protein secretion pathway component TatC
VRLLLAGAETTRLRYKKAAGVTGHMAKHGLGPVSRLKISLLTFIITFSVFYLLFDHIMAFFWSYAVKNFSLSGVASGASLADIRFLLPVSIAFANAFPAFIFEIISFFDPLLKKEQQKIGILGIVSYAILLIAAGLAFSYLFGLPLLLGQVAESNAALGLPNYIGLDQFFGFLLLSLILGSLIAQIAFMMLIAIRRLHIPG